MCSAWQKKPNFTEQIAEQTASRTTKLPYAQKTIRAQALFVDTVIPPIPHRPTGNELFNLVAKPYSRQIRAIFEGRLINLPDGGGYVDAYQRAITECPLPNHLQPIV